MHAVAPLASWYSPPGQPVHVALPGVAVKVPGAQAVGAVEPVAHALPTGHGEQSLASSRLAAFEYDPAKHGNSADAPGGQ